MVCCLHADFSTTKQAALPLWNIFLPVMHIIVDNWLSDKSPDLVMFWAFFMILNGYDNSHISCSESIGSQKFKSEFQNFSEP